MLEDLRKDVKKASNPEKARQFQRFFKTGKGEYAFGDVFVGLTVPQSRALAKKYLALSLKEAEALLKSKIHEERLIALLILSTRFVKGDESERAKIHKLYLKNTKFVNNWDLVDTSAEYIVGMYCYEHGSTLLTKLARSKSLWERRIAMIATFYFIKQGESKETLKIAKLLLKDDHDLIHKAAGWMLREMGKRVSEKDLRKFLDQYASQMPRTMLRYALEKLPPQDRQYYMKL